MREEKRLHISGHEQMAALTALAHWMKVFGPLPRDQALQALGLDEDAPGARLVDNPHALLRSPEISWWGLSIPSLRYFSGQKRGG